MEQILLSIVDENIWAVLCTMKSHANHLELSKIYFPKAWTQKNSTFIKPANIKEAAKLEVLHSSLWGSKWFGFKNSTCITFSARNMLMSRVLSEYKLPVIIGIRSGNLMYSSMMIIANNTALYTWRLLKE